MGVMLVVVSFYGGGDRWVEVDFGEKGRRREKRIGCENVLQRRASLRSRGF